MMGMVDMAKQSIRSPAEKIAHDLVSNLSLEVTTRGFKPADLSAHFPPGTKVTVTFLPGQDLDEFISCAAELRQAGFKLVPHLAARTLQSHDEFARLVFELQRKAEIDEVVAIGGDLPRAAGPFGSTLDLLKTGVLEGNGISSVAFAGHPEGHPQMSGNEMDRALLDKLDYTGKAGLSARIITQFCFDPEPVFAYLAHLKKAGIDAPVTLGVAGPATLATLVRYARICGVGPSMRMLYRRSTLFGQAAMGVDPDSLIDPVAERMAEGQAGIAGLHLYPFGGISRLGEWRTRRLTTG